MRAIGLLPPTDEETEDPCEVGDPSHSITQDPRREPIIDHDEGQGSSFSAFTEHKPPVFQGGANPIVCMHWLRKIS